KATGRPQAKMSELLGSSTVAASDSTSPSSHEIRNTRVIYQPIRERRRPQAAGMPKLGHYAQRRHTVRTHRRLRGHGQGSDICRKQGGTHPFSRARLRKESSDWTLVQSVESSGNPDLSHPLSDRVTLLAIHPPSSR